MRCLCRKSRAGISSVVGVAALVLVFIAMTSFYITLLYKLTENIQYSLNIVEDRIEGEAVLKSLSGWWNTSGTCLVANITSRYPQTLLITTITVVFSDATKVILSQYNETAVGGNSYIILKKAGGEVVTNALKLPLALGPGQTAILHFCNLKMNKDAEILTVTLTVSNPSTLVALPLKNWSDTLH